MRWPSRDRRKIIFTPSSDCSGSSTALGSSGISTRTVLSSLGQVSKLFFLRESVKINSLRFLSLFLTLVCLISITFILLQIVPGNPFTDRENLPVDAYQRLNMHYGLDLPWYWQLWKYLKAAFTWDFGFSLVYHGRSVTDIIKEGFPISAVLGLEALFLAFSMGIAFALIAARYPGSHRLVMTITTAVISIPSFMIATVLQYFLALKAGVLPIASWGSFAHTLLPAISLSLMPAANIARLVRANLLKAQEQNYMRTARAKGLSQWSALFKHGLRNALLPLLPYFGQIIGNILVGSFIIEQIFGIPGLGKWFVLSVNNRDYSVVMGMTLFYCEILLMMVFLSDLLYRHLDPRLKTS